MQNISTIDDFTDLVFIDKGSQGFIFKAYQPSSNKIFALKVLNIEDTDKEKRISQLSEEFKIMDKITCRYILKVHSFSLEGKVSDSKGVVGTLPYMVMEFAQNSDLSHLVLKTKGLSENLILFLAKQLILAIELLHKDKIAHRDIKLKNVLFDADYNCKLADFGMAIKTSSTEKVKKSMGTRGYSSPQIHNKKPYNAMKGDVFALGVFLFLLRFSCFPFPRKESFNKYYNLFRENKMHFWTFHILRTNINCSAEFKELIEGMLAFEEEERFSIFQVSTSKFIKTKVNEKEARSELEGIFSSSKEG